MPKQRNNIIELNGRRYDSVTGQLIIGGKRLSIEPIVVTPSQTKTTVPPIFETKSQPALKSRPVDGFSRPISQPKSATQIHVRTKKSVTLKRPAQPVKLIVKETGAKVTTTAPTRAAQEHSLKAHHPVKSPTLMRQAVKKPAISRKPKLAAASHSAQLVKQPPQGISLKRMSDKVDEQRLERAYRTPQHAKVKRFYEPVRLAATARPAIPVHVPVTPAPVAALPKVQSMPASKLSNADQIDVFAKALRSARSHEEVYQPAKKTHRGFGKLVLSGAVSLAVLGLVGGVLYFNRSGIEMQFVAAQAGFNAALPTYKPAGFNYQGTDHQPGSVILYYQSATTEAHYQITEQPSAWNSQTLLDTYVSTQQQTYRTAQVGGRTVYLIGDSNATWVSGGIWFQIQTNGGSLSSDQLLKIAASL